MRIYNQTHGTLSAPERLELARLLIKAGYIVRLGRDKPNDSPKAPWRQFVEYEEVTMNG